MTLKNLASGTPKHENKLKHSPKIIQSFEVIDSEKFSSKEILEYFNSPRYNKDLDSIILDMNISIRQYNIDPKEFLLYFREDPDGLSLCLDLKSFFE